MLAAIVAAVTLEIGATTGIIVDAESGEVLWERDSHRHMYPASTTKIMTALLVVEGMTPDERVVAPRNIRTIGESSLHLVPDEELTADDLLKGILLRSGNDAAYAAAIHISATKEKFAQLMNDRATELGCADTHFTNPNGLHDAQHYTSAYDLSIMARTAMKYDWFRQTVGLRSATINRSKNYKDTYLTNHNTWLGQDSRALGIKTGFTTPAGHCFVGCAELDGKTIITVQMKNSKDWVQDQVRMVDWAFTFGYSQHSGR